MNGRRCTAAQGAAVVGAIAITVTVALLGGVASASSRAVPRTMVGCWHRHVPALPVGTPAGVWLMKITPAGKLAAYTPGTTSCGADVDFYGDDLRRRKPSDHRLGTDLRHQGCLHVESSGEDAHAARNRRQGLFPADAAVRWSVEEVTPRRGTYGGRPLAVTTVGAGSYYPRCCGRSSVGRASASQAEGRGFEPHRPLLQWRL